jgi:hypothetical protein
MAAPLVIARPFYIRRYFNIGKKEPLLGWKLHYWHWFWIRIKLWAIYCDLAIIEGLTKNRCRKHCCPLYCDMYQCIVVCEYFSASYAWGTGHDPANLFEACCGQMPTVTMAGQDLIKYCTRPHAFDCGMLVCSLCMLCMACATFLVCSQACCSQSQRYSHCSLLVIEFRVCSSILRLTS